MPGIQVEAVSKRFRRYAKNRPYTLQEAFLRGFRHLEVEREFWALEDVSLDVGAGEMVGIIGRNGAGKSTLLRVIGGISEPERGRVVVDGRLGALIELGAGFHPELTGRENVYMNGVISGYRRRQVAAILDDIVGFAELEAFIDNPVRTYSSGMQLRLAFSVAVHVQPEVLLVDEVLAVGDLGFQRKCLDRIAGLRAGGAAILFVTHDLAQAQQTCDRIAWLDKGHVVAWGAAAEVVDAYRRSMPETPAQGGPQPGTLPKGEVELRLNVNRFGTQALMLGDVRLVDGDGQIVEVLQPGRELAVQMRWQTAEPLLGVIVSVGIHSADGALLCEVQLPVGMLPGRQGQAVLRFERLDLAAGAYFLDVGAYSVDWSVTYDYHWRVYQLHVGGHGESKGPLRPPYDWELSATTG